MLSADVIAAISGGVLTMTADQSGDHAVNVFRLDAEHITVAAANCSTTINGVTAAIFEISDLAGVQVNLSGQFDTFSVYSAPNNPVLNIGAAGVVFQGAGSAGDVLNVYNASTQPMSILGDVVVQGTTAGSPLNVRGLRDSEFRVHADSAGDLLIAGSISIGVAGSGTGSLTSEISSLGMGDVLLLGNVTESLKQAKSGAQTNRVATYGSGQIVIAGALVEFSSGGTGMVTNEIVTDGTGGIRIAGPVTQTGILNSQQTRNLVQASEPQGGDIVIAATLTQRASNLAGSVENDVLDLGTGDIIVGGAAGGLVQSATCYDSSGFAVNLVQGGYHATGEFRVGTSGIQQTANSSLLEMNCLENDGAGAWSDASLIRQAGLGQNSQRLLNFIGIGSMGAFTIGTSVSQSGYSSEYVNNSLVICGGASGNLSVGTWVAQTSAGRNLDNYVSNSGSGALTVGAYIAQKSQAMGGHTDNEVYTAGTGSLNVGSGGILMTDSNAVAGGNANSVYTRGAGKLTTTGVIRITTSNVGDQSSAATVNVVKTGKNALGTIAAAGIVIVNQGDQDLANRLVAGAAPIQMGKAGVVWTSTGAGSHVHEITSSVNAPVVIQGSLNVQDMGMGHSSLSVIANGDNAGISMGGSLIYSDSMNTTSHCDIRIQGGSVYQNSAVTIEGSLTLVLAQTTGTVADRRAATANHVILGSLTHVAGFSLVVKGQTMIVGGEGQDDVAIRQARFQLGTTINLLGNPNLGPAWGDHLALDGTTFGGQCAIQMQGNYAQLEMNNGQGYQAEPFSGSLQVLMAGWQPEVVIATGAGVGYEPVVFYDATFISAPASGGVFYYNALKVAGDFNVTGFLSAIV
ncbi:MAG: hypothetical protein JSS02_15695 [Planctomycetes bacterium]|nr:hypothetical protein [Planctomycetota bacterium]